MTGAGERSDDKEFVLTSEPMKVQGGGVVNTLTTEFSDLTDSNRGDIQVTGITTPAYMEGVYTVKINGEQVATWDTSPSGPTGSREETFNPPLTFSGGELVVEVARDSWHTVPDLGLVEIYGYVDKETVDTPGTVPWGDDA